MVSADGLLSGRPLAHGLRRRASERRTVGACSPPTGCERYFWSGVNPGLGLTPVWSSGRPFYSQQGRLCRKLPNKSFALFFKWCTRLCVRCCLYCVPVRSQSACVPISHVLVIRPSWKLPSHIWCCLFLIVTLNALWFLTMPAAKASTRACVCLVRMLFCLWRSASTEILGHRCSYRLLV